MRRGRDLSLTVPISLWYTYSKQLRRKTMEEMEILVSNLNNNIEDYLLNLNNNLCLLIEIISQNDSINVSHTRADIQRLLEQ